MAKNKTNIIEGGNSEAMERATRKLNRATRWRERNPQAWEYVVKTAQAQHDQGGRISGRQLVEAVRKKEFADVDGMPTRINNDFSAIVARWLATEHPRLRGSIKFRHTALDEIM